MDKIIIKKIKEFDWDISVYINNELINKAWSNNGDNALRKAKIFSDYYIDQNGQALNIEVNNG